MCRCSIFTKSCCPHTSWFGPSFSKHLSLRRSDSQSSVISLVYDSTLNLLLIALWNLVCVFRKTFRTSLKVQCALCFLTQHADTRSSPPRWPSTTTSSLSLGSWHHPHPNRRHGSRCVGMTSEVLSLLWTWCLSVCVCGKTLGSGSFWCTRVNVALHLHSVGLSSSDEL